MNYLLSSSCLHIQPFLKTYHIANLLVVVAHFHFLLFVVAGVAELQSLDLKYHLLLRLELTTMGLYC